MGINGKIGRAKEVRRIRKEREAEAIKPVSMYPTVSRSVHGITPGPRRSGNSLEAISKAAAP